jgi:glycosyltransferase involved in cell wall biosynthesis
VAWAERASFALADVVISPNDSYRRIALERGRCSPDDVFVVRSAPRAAEFPLREAPFDRHGHRHLVGYLGVMGKQDGVDLLVRAVARLVSEGWDIMLYLAGDGESRPDITRLVAECALGERVVMPGYQSSGEFTPALLAADVCVAPDPSSPFNDISTMNKVVEYMALGRPTVVFPLPENRVTGEDTVAYADDCTWEGLAAAIARLLADDDERRRLGDAARSRFLAKLGWERSEPHLLRAYERLAEKVTKRGAVAQAAPSGAA